jgi:hypothetical protein
MIEHFSKWLELVPLLDCSSEGVAYAFLDKMLNKFGVLVEVLTDQGTKFERDFQDLCEKALIDHWTTSQDHLKAYVLTNRRFIQVQKHKLY